MSQIQTIRKENLPSYKRRLQIEVCISVDQNHHTKASVIKKSWQKSPKTCKAAQNAFKVAQEMDQTKIYHGPRPAKVVRVKVPDQTEQF